MRSSINKGRVVWLLFLLVTVAAGKDGNYFTGPADQSAKTLSGFPRLGGFPDAGPPFRRPDPVKTYGSQNPYGPNPYPPSPYHPPSNKQPSSGSYPPGPSPLPFPNNRPNYYQNQGPVPYRQDGYSNHLPTYPYPQQPSNYQRVPYQSSGPDHVPTKPFTKFPTPFAGNGLFGRDNGLNLLNSIRSKSGSVPTPLSPLAPHPQNPTFLKKQNLPKTFSYYQNPYTIQQSLKLNPSQPSQQKGPGQYFQSFSNSAAYAPPPQTSQTYSQGSGIPRVYQNSQVAKAHGGQSDKKTQTKKERYADGDQYSKKNAYTVSGGDSGRGGHNSKTQTGGHTSDHGAYSDRKSGASKDSYNNSYSTSSNYDSRDPEATHKGKAAHGAGFEALGRGVDAVKAGAGKGLANGRLPSFSFPNVLGHGLGNLF
ncbi:uncharacterized protein LOC143284095 [Babylonia areolata]|uniref:uncharacterized protein LOC143284095 n=1 Tax=Babylonia areolata TaxID=304850 RepID=UPI003FD1F62B